MAGVTQTVNGSGRSILTTTPNPATSATHNRMPVILDPDHYDLWLDPGMLNIEAISELLKPYDARLMRSYPVSSRVNLVAHDDEECTRPVEVAELQSVLFRWTNTDMKIAARVSNTSFSHSVEVETEGRKQSIVIAPKSIGRGSSINGGELLFTALATCFCNDLYREAAKRAINVQEVKVEVTETFGGPGEPAREISYGVRVRADASQTEIDDLIRTADAVTEIQNTVRHGCAVKLIVGGW
jgi:organic hydroperoxide reductase OsmC/OhrA